MTSSEETTIEIDIDVYRALEARRTSFQQSRNDILRNVFSLPDLPTKSAALPPALPTPRRTGTFAFQLHGKRVEAQSLKDAYLRCLEALAEIEPRFLERLGQLSTRARRLVARQPEHLYLSSPDLAEKHAAPLLDGWWVDTNLSRQQCEKRLQAACEVARIQFGRDLTLEFPD